MPWPSGNPWPDELINTLKRMWSQRDEAGLHHVYSLDQIGEAIGRGRNAAIGKAHRLKLPHRSQLKTRTARTMNGHDPSSPVAQRKKPVRPSQKEVEMSQPTQLVLPDALRVPLIHIKENQCRSILDERGPDGLVVFCGAPTAIGRSFCPTHMKLYYQPPRSRGGERHVV